MEERPYFYLFRKGLLTDLLASKASVFINMPLFCVCTFIVINKFTFDNVREQSQGKILNWLFCGILS